MNAYFNCLRQRQGVENKLSHVNGNLIYMLVFIGAIDILKDRKDKLDL